MSNASTVERLEQSAVDLQDETGLPQLHQVILLNDDTTPMEFVVELLVLLYGHAFEMATKLMLTVHHQGKGIAGVYPLEIAEAKVAETIALARLHGHPLHCFTEPETAT